RRRGSGALPARGGPVHAACAQGDVRRADPDPAAAATRRGRARRPRARRDVHAVAARRRSRRAGVDAPRAGLRRARDPSHPAPASLVEAARRNSELGAEDIALFEVARVYLPGPALPDEQTHVAAVVEGGWPRAKGIV